MRTSFLNGEEKNTDNYIMLCEKWRKIYRDLEHDVLERQFGLECDEEARYITYLRNTVWIRRAVC